jgi:hypothetical protein
MKGVKAMELEGCVICKKIRAPGFSMCPHCLEIHKWKVGAARRWGLKAAATRKKKQDEEESLKVSPLAAVNYEYNQKQKGRGKPSSSVRGRLISNPDANFEVDKQKTA